MRLTALSVTVAVAFQVAQGRVYESLESLPDRSYDFIVVGGTTTNLPTRLGAVFTECRLASW